MRKMFIVPAFLLGVTTLLPVIAAGQTIDVKPQSWDFGDLQQQVTRSFDVTITNKGAAKLIISEVKADCGCTVPEMQIKELGPGQSAPLHIEFNSKRFSGKVFKTVKIYSNDPAAPVSDVILTANVHTPLLVDPPSRRLGFPQALEGEQAVRKATFTAVDAPELEIKADRSKHGLFEVEVHNKIDGDPRKAELVVTRPAGMKPGSHRDNVRVQTNLPDMPTVDIELKADVRSPIQVSPPRLNFRYRLKFDLNMRVQAFEHLNEFKILGVESDLPEIKIGEIIEAPGGVHIIPIKGAPISPDDPRAIAAKGRIKGSIIIKTDLPSMPQVTVPVTYMIRM